MKLLKGSVVRAEAGRDGGGYFAVVDADERYCFIADGKSRKLAKPKRKNIKHVSLTNSMVDLKDITDKKLRTLMKQFGEDE
ncbi:MAG: KOW domain-containing RNA-binding protein [Ruminococcus sp.]|nr:KOW domain-containing RNA-binding protein [Ruminococcus sp.]